MNGIVIDIDPIIVHLGFIELRWYGLFFALGILAGIWLSLREVRRRGLDVDQMQSLAMWAVAGGLIGARLFHVVDRWDLYSSDPMRVFAIGKGGLAVYGGLIGGSLTVLVYTWRQRLPLWRIADAVAPGLILGQAVGRLGCIANGDAYGEPTGVPWAFVYTNPAAMLPRDLLDVPTQPYVAYEIVFDLALLALLWRLRSVYKIDGLLFVTYIGAYSSARFLLTYFRLERVWFWGLQEAQVIALLMLGATLLLLVRLLWLAPRGVAAAPNLGTRYQ